MAQTANWLHMKPSSRPQTLAQPDPADAEKQHPTVSALDLESFLPYRLIRLSHAISRGIAAGYQLEFGISIAEWRVLAVIARFPDSSASQLAEHTGIDKVAMHRAVRALQQRHLITSAKPAHDRRRQHLQLTSDGQQLHAAIAPRVLEFEQRLLTPLSAADEQRLHALLQQLEHSVATLHGAGQTV